MSFSMLGKYHKKGRTVLVFAVFYEYILGDYS